MAAGLNSKGVEGVYKRETETKDQKSKKGREESMISREGINKLERGTRNTLQPSTQKLEGHQCISHKRQRGFRYSFPPIEQKGHDIDKVRGR